MDTIRFSLEEIDAAAAALLASYPLQRVFALVGELGAGKTTFVQALCRNLGFAGEVNSPTFSLVNEYPAPGGPIYHMDLYRIQSEEELLQLGLPHYLDSGHYCFIEWPEKAASLLHSDTVHFSLSVLPQNSRILQVESF